VTDAARLLLLVLTLLALSGCSVLVPRECGPGTQVESIRTDSGPIYICAPID
jgi:hypothetical protein